MSEKIEKLKAEFQVDIGHITSLHKRATQESAGLVGASIDNDEDAQDANEMLRDWLSNLDAVSLLKKETLAPLKEAQKRVDALFKPLLDKGAELTSGIRKMLSDYELEKRKAQREAMAKAAEAANDPAPEKLMQALQEVEEAAPTELAGTSFTRVWKVKRILKDMLPPEWWMPDEKAIAAFGKAHKGDDPPVIPGVVWEEELSSRVRR